MTNKEEVKTALEKSKLILILRRVPDDKLIPLCDTLASENIKFIEVTFDHTSPDCVKKTTAAISRISERYSTLHIGAGTVLSPDEVKAAYDSGAQYIISPDTNPEVIAAAGQYGMVSIPGAFTPSEITYAYRSGADYVKLFPAVIGNGVEYLKAVAAPLGHIPLLAVGGITPETIPAFLRAGVKGFGVSSGIVNAAALLNGDYDVIAACAREFVNKLK